MECNFLEAALAEARDGRELETVLARSPTPVISSAP